MRKIGMILLIIMFFGLVLTGCGEKTASKEVYIDILVGNRSNNQEFRTGENATTLNQLVTLAVETQGAIGITVIDGSAFQTFDKKIELATNFDWLSSSKKSQLIKDEIDEIKLLLQSDQTRAKTGEADILGAIEIASRSLRAAGEGGDKILVIMDNGLSTCNPLNFSASNLLGGNAEVTADSIVAALKKCDSIPDLKGIQVTWIGMADVNSPQQELSDSNKKVLKEIWRRILVEGGATVTFAEDLPEGTRKTDSGLPYVSTVSIQESVSVKIDDSLQNNEEIPQINILTGDTIAFIESSFEYINEEAARVVLKKYADYLIENRSEKKVLAGTTATVGSQEDCVVFSKGRAQTVADTLIEMGVLPEQLVVTGLGYENLFHIPDIDSQGLLNENASQNRSVIIMDIQAQEAQEILEKEKLN